MNPDDPMNPDEENNSTGEKPAGEDTAIDGVIREYARTGSSSDDEPLIAEVNRRIDKRSGNSPNRQTVGDENKLQPWIFGKYFWRTAAAAATLFVLYFGLQSLFVYQEKADPTELIVFTQPRLAPGGVASIRALVRNGQTHRPLPNAEVRAILVSEKNGRIDLGNRTTDLSGLVLIEADVPGDSSEGEYTLEIVAEASTGDAMVKRPLPLTRSFRTMLSCDKPLYQSGQTIHLRALSLDNDSLRPAAGRGISFEIRDPKGNKVFAKTLTTSDFGIATADFQLANQVNEGAYTIAATIDDTTSERTVQVDRYTLPKYKIDLTSDRDYYSPGEMVEVVVDCQYTFGKPVAGAEVKITAQEFVEGFRDFHTLNGNADNAGRIRFELPLKKAFVGQPLNKGDAFVRLKAEVTDRAGETRKSSHEIKVTKHPIRIEVFPESGELVQNVANKIYIVTAYPNGKPARTTLTLNNDQSKTVETSRLGIASVELTPKSRNLKLTLQAKDQQGLVSQVSKALRVGKRSDAFLLRTDQAIYRHGDAVQLDIVSATKARRVFVDVVKNGRSAMTQSVAIESGSGHLVLDLPSDLSGTLQLQAYSILDNGEMIRDTKVIQVNRSDDLTIRAQLDQESYQPAEKAMIEFLVTGKDGEPVEAALSLAAVDEAVFALNDMRPGLEEMYFLIQEEILKPRYQLMAQPPVDMTRFPLDESQPELIEADVVVLSGAEGTNAEPDSARSESFAARDAKVSEAKTEHEHKLLSLIPWIPLSAVGLLFLGIALFTISRFRRPSEAPAESRSADHHPETKKFRGRIRQLFWTFLGAVFLPVLIVMFCGIFDLLRDDDTALVLFIFLNLLGFGALAMIVQGTRRTTVALKNQAMRRALLAIPFIYILFILAVASVIWASMHDWVNWEQSKGPWIILCLACVVVLVVSALPTWWRAEMGKFGIFWGLLDWLGRAALLLFVLAIPMTIIPAASSARVKRAMPMQIRDGAKAAGEFVKSDVLLNEFDEFSMAMEISENTQFEMGKQVNSPPRVRKFFPETLLWQPQILTDENGSAKLEVPLADSITTWRLSGSAISEDGRLGSMEKGIRVFQDFFIDIDFPVELTQNDEVAVPIAIFNYLDRPQTVEIDIKSAPWFEFTGKAAGKQIVTLSANSVSNATCQLRALKPGAGKLTVFAKGEQLTDAVERVVTVNPNGRKVETAVNGRLNNGSASEKILIPDDSIEGGNDLYLKIYPGAFSQVVEGMDSIFQMPYGCFEQTSSTTYPNILTLNYMQETGQIVPEIEMKALNFINIGYQRLLSYEVDGGGFDWFGNPPAHTVLTAYGLMEFVDMAEVYEIDQTVIERTREWLMSKQADNGSWEPPNRGIAEGAINNFQGNQTLRTTAYIAWAIARAGGQEKLDSAVAYLVQNCTNTDDPYTLAICAQVFHEVGKKQEANKLFLRLDETVKTDDDTHFAWWSAAGEGLTHGRGESFDIETTAIVAQAFLAARHNVGTAHKALSWLIDQKDPRGTWHSTQATVQAMRALLAGAITDGAGVSEGDIDLTFHANGAEAGSLTISDENRDVYHLISLSNWVKKGVNIVDIEIDQAANLAYQIVAIHHNPVDVENATDEASGNELLTIETNYSTTQLATKDKLEVSVELSYHRPESAPMTLVDFGIPPGFEIVAKSFEALVEKGIIKRFAVNGKQVTLYFDSIPGGGETTDFAYRLRAKFPVKVQAPAVVAYQYYEPEIRDQSVPVILTVVE